MYPALVRVLARDRLMAQGGALPEAQVREGLRWDGPTWGGGGRGTVRRGDRTSEEFGVRPIEPPLAPGTVV